MNKTVIGLALIVLVGGVFLYQLFLGGEPQEIIADSSETQIIEVPENFGSVVAVAANRYNCIVILFENGVYVSGAWAGGLYEIVWVEV